MGPGTGSRVVFFFLKKKRKCRGVYAFHANVWAFLCMVKAMSMDIIELSIHAFVSVAYSIPAFSEWFGF